MKIRIILISLIMMLCVMPLSAQNSPAGGLAAGNVVNRDVDTYMMVNFAQFVNYDSFFSFAQLTYTQVHSPAPLVHLPGFQGGFGKKYNGNCLHFYLNTSGYSLNASDTSTNTAGTELESYNKNGSLNLQFDTVFGNADLGIFKLGMNFWGVNKKETMTHTSVSDYTKTTASSGYFFPTLEYGWDKINNDYSMLLLGGKVGVRIPINNGSTITEKNIGGVITTTTSAAATSDDFPAADFYNNTRLEIAPQLWIFFTPKLEPMLIISSLYLINTLTFQIYPDEIETIEQKGLANGYTRREHSYVGDTLFGYYNMQYSISSHLSAAWRVNFSAGFYYDKKGYTKDKAAGAAAETVTKVDNEVLYLTVNIAPRLAFSYQLVPAVLAFNGAIIFNAVGPTNAIGWQLYRRTSADVSADSKTVQNEHIFNGINPIFNVGAAWNINPYLLFEAGVSLNTSKAAKVLDEVNIGLVFKK